MLNVPFNTALRKIDLNFFMKLKIKLKLKFKSGYSFIESRFFIFTLKI